METAFYRLSPSSSHYLLVRKNRKDPKHKSSPKPDLNNAAAQHTSSPWQGLAATPVEAELNPFWSKPPQAALGKKLNVVDGGRGSILAYLHNDHNAVIKCTPTFRILLKVLAHMFMDRLISRGGSPMMNKGL